MSLSTDVLNQINRMISHLVEIGLASDQNVAVLKRTPAGIEEIGFTGSHHVSAALKDREYREIYDGLAAERSYNVKMLDGALIQMMYTFRGDEVIRHRLTFFPAYDLEEFQNNPDLYLLDEVYADVVARSIVPFPVRFDYSADEGFHQAIHHPKSHLTLGQYKNCRIPVTAPITPFWFVDFILRNFYHTAFVRYADKLPRYESVFADCIGAEERGVVHLQLPACAAA